MKSLISQPFSWKIFHYDSSGTKEAWDYLGFNEMEKEGEMGMMLKKIYQDHTGIKGRLGHGLFQIQPGCPWEPLTHLVPLNWDNIHATDRDDFKSAPVWGRKWIGFRIHGWCSDEGKLKSLLDNQRGTYSSGERSWKESPVPWLVWLSGLGIIPQAERSPVWFLVRAHAWVVHQDPGWRRIRGSQSMFISLTDVSPFLLLPLFKNKNIKILKKKRIRNKRGSEKQTPYDLTYKWNLINKINSQAK